MVSRIGLAPRITTQRARPPQRPRLGAAGTKKRRNHNDSTRGEPYLQGIPIRIRIDKTTRRRAAAAARPQAHTNARAGALGIPNSENRTTEFFVIRLASPGAKTEPESRHSIGSSVACLLRPVEPPSWRLTWRPPRCASRPTPRPSLGLRCPTATRSFYVQPLACRCASHVCSSARASRLLARYFHTCRYTLLQTSPHAHAPQRLRVS